MTRATPGPETVTVHIPFRLVKRGGRKEMQMPDGASNQSKMDNTLVKALARAFRWKRMLESGEFTTITELAKYENLALTYLTRVLRLSLLAPDIAGNDSGGTAGAVSDGVEPSIRKHSQGILMTWTQHLGSSQYQRFSFHSLDFRPSLFVPSQGMV